MSDEPTTPIKNEHILYAYGPLKDKPGNMLILGITHIGLDYLRSQNKTLTVTPPFDIKFSEVVIFSEPTKEGLKGVLRMSGLPIDEVKLDKL